MTAIQVLGKLVWAGVTISACVAVVRQCRKPASLPGRFLLWTMNKRHAGVTNWGLGHVAIEKSFTILDVGCGGGQTIHTLATAASEGKVYGIDYSAASVAASRRTNEPLIRSGRVDVRQASVSSLPFPERTFDVVSAVETHYYWPQPVADMREILRVLKPGGRLVVIAETYRGERFDRLIGVAMKLLSARYLTIEQHRELLAAAGYRDIAIFVEEKKGWICCVASRPPDLGDVPSKPRYADVSP